MLSRSRTASAPLAAVGVVMIIALAGAFIGLGVDPRTITGAPAWLKPAKFAASIAIYTFTLAWIFSLIPEWRRTRRLVEWTTAVTLVLEMLIIGVQAFRGTTSHFNVATVLDAALFAVMGTAILVQTFSSVAVAAALWRHSFPDAAMGWAVRFGMAITIAGALSGGLMTRPTDEQLAKAAAGERMTVAGAHTVGAPDGGPGLPGTGWSTEHGDLRVPHFIGLHALQVLPIVSVVLARRRLSDVVRTRLMLTAGVSYAALFGVLLAQALRGQPLLAPDSVGIALLAAWALATGLAVTLSTLPVQPSRSPAAL